MKQLSKTILLLAIAAALSSPVAAKEARRASPSVAVAPQYDTTHVYVAPDDVDRFATSFLATFGGKSTKQVVATVTPTPSSTTSQLLQTPVGTVSLFGFKTPIPYPFGGERNGYLVRDIDVAIRQARAAGASVIVSTFPDPIGRDAVVQWPGGINMQLYWHTTKPDYAAFTSIPENRVYVAADRAEAFVRSFVKFSHGRIVSDSSAASGAEVGKADAKIKRIRIESAFGKMSVFVTDGHLPYPYGHETTGYEVADLDATIAKAKEAGVTVLVPPYSFEDRKAAMLQFPGGYVAEIHAAAQRHAAAAE
ncbi:glyoxalase [Rhodopseudomonas palustris]|uniref:VOC family protein n=1 Tax=Rhodopseudomonas palustris TaxID=1076 RepID=UPI0022F12415|nr:glyoxalase [Rhodopseudomonas palustris]WBU31940.1 glyoxalase [Rhodopseudomonas palustris]